MTLLKDCQKAIKLVDRSELGWAVVMNIVRMNWLKTQKIRKELQR